MEQLIICPADDGRYAVRPVSWAGIWDKSGLLASECKSIAYFDDEQDAKDYIVYRTLGPVEELRGIGTGEWLWVECLEKFKADKAVSSYYRKHRDYTQGDGFCCGYPGVSFGFCFSDYGISWLAYRRKPDGGGE